MSQSLQKQKCKKEKSGKECDKNIQNRIKRDGCRKIQIFRFKRNNR